MSSTCLGKRARPTSLSSSEEEEEEEEEIDYRPFPTSGRKRRKKSWEEMTEEERSKLSKKERRAAKNRTSAMNSRGRKRKEMEELREKASKATFYEDQAKEQQKVIERLVKELKVLRKKVGVEENEEGEKSLSSLPTCLRRKCSADELTNTSTNDDTTTMMMMSIDNNKGYECDGGVFEILQRSRTIPVVVTVSE